MKQINIAETQRTNLCEELARLTYQFRKNNDIKCIYFAPYDGLGDISGNVIEVTLVKDNEEDVTFLAKIEDYNKEHQEQSWIQKLGLQIYLSVDNLGKYTNFDLNPSESARSNALMNSSILYDENGDFTKIKKQITKRFKRGITNIYYYYDNLVQIVPPLDKTLGRTLDVKHMKMETEAVKEFTNTESFQYIKNM